MGKFVAEIRNEANTDSTVIDLFGEIGNYWEENDMVSFINQIKEIKSSNISLNISSIGGVTLHALAIYDAIKGHNAYVTGNLSGIVASAATLLSSGCDHCVASHTLQFMVHQNEVITMGNSNDLRKTASILDNFDNTAVNIYRKKTKQPVSKIREWMKNETWFTAAEAKKYGFVDEIKEGLVMNAAIPANIDFLKNTLGCKSIPSAIINTVMNDKTTTEISKEEIVNEVTESVKAENKSLLNNIKNLFSAKKEEEKETPNPENISMTDVKNEVKNSMEAIMVEAMKPVAEAVKNLTTEVSNLKNDNEAKDLKIKSLVNDISNMKGNSATTEDAPDNGNPDKKVPELSVTMSFNDAMAAVTSKLSEEDTRPKN